MLTPITYIDNRLEVITCWKAYVASLLRCESNLLRNVWIEQTWRQVLSDERMTIIIISDGGQKYDRGAFGWVIGMQMKMIATNQGIAQGNPMSSYRVEGYGKLSVLRFLIQYMRFYKV